VEVGTKGVVIGDAVAADDPAAFDAPHDAVTSEIPTKKPLQVRFTAGRA
jgi:hypothetical protein